MYTSKPKDKENKGLCGGQSLEATAEERTDAGGGAGFGSTSLESSVANIQGAESAGRSGDGAGGKSGSGWESRFAAFAVGDKDYDLKDVCSGTAENKAGSSAVSEGNAQDICQWNSQSDY